METYKESQLTPSAYIAEVKKRFAEAGDPVRAEGQKKYLRNQFDFFGLKAPEWREIGKKMFREKGLFTGTALRNFVRQCFEEKKREMHYFGIEMYERQLQKEGKSSIDFLEELICKNAWWDTVDWLVKLIGIQLQRFPSLVGEKNRQWIESDNFWLQRTAILFQLKYKDQTDEQLLFKNILRRADSIEFFVQKGAGWALREYSKTNPGRVEVFIRDHELPPLTKREGLKWIKRNL